MRKYRVRWKNEEVGKFSVPEIRQMLASGKLGFFHTVLTDEGWVFLQNFLETAEDDSSDDFTLGQIQEFEKSNENLKQECVSSQKPVKNRASRNAHKNSRLSVFGYSLAGLAFLSFYFAVATVIFAFAFKDYLGKKEALRVVYISLATSLLGLLFFKEVLPQLGW